MATLKLKRPIGSGKFNVMFPKNTDLNYFIENGQIKVEHHIKDDAIITVKRKEVIFNND